MLEKADGDLKLQLKNVFWLGGGSGAGKSTIGRRVASAFDMHYYPTDKTILEHCHNVTVDECPSVHEFFAMDMDERWLNRSPKVMLDTFHFYRGECFTQIINDLKLINTDNRVLVEGFRLLPDLVAPLLADIRQSIWLLPSPQFRQMAFSSRGGLYDIAGKTSNPERALQNLLKRDEMFTDRLRNLVDELELPSINVELSMEEEKLYSLVLAKFNLI